jgi:acetyl-CoA carboxylase biotin carboxyl carrier protein
MTVDEIRELIKLANEAGVAELEVQRGENRVRIRLGAASAGHQIGTAVPTVSPSAQAQPAPAPPTQVPKQEEASQPPTSDLILVKAPIVGTFYESPKPGDPPFVRPGDRVQPGRVLCIIESMKLMNEIEAETSGVIERKLVLDGQPVEFGEALYAIRPV